MTKESASFLAGDLMPSQDYPTLKPFSLLSGRVEIETIDDCSALENDTLPPKQATFGLREYKPGWTDYLTSEELALWRVR